MYDPAASTRYGHVASVLRSQIRTGDYSVGDELPTIARLAQDFGVSHMTAKQALRILREQGIISTGRGTRARVMALPADAPASVAEQFDAVHARLDAVEARTRALEVHAAKTTRRRSAKP